MVHFRAQKKKEKEQRSRTHLREPCLKLGKTGVVSIKSIQEGGGE